jgi:hypothetical protein
MYVMNSNMLKLDQKVDFSAHICTTVEENHKADDSLQECNSCGSHSDSKWEAAHSPIAACWTALSSRICIHLYNYLFSDELGTTLPPD